MSGKKKIMITAGVIVAVILVSLACINISSKIIYGKSDDGKWRLCYSKTLFNDLWSGYLFYTGNYSGDAGNIKVKEDFKSEEIAAGWVEYEPQNYYKTLNLSNFISCGLRRKTTYGISDLIYGRPESVTIKIKWKENGMEYVSTIETD